MRSLFGRPLDSDLTHSIVCKVERQMLHDGSASIVARPITRTGAHVAIPRATHAN